MLQAEIQSRETDVISVLRLCKVKVPLLLFNILYSFFIVPVWFLDGTKGAVSPSYLAHGTSLLRPKAKGPKVR